MDENHTDLSLCPDSTLTVGKTAQTCLMPVYENFTGMSSQTSFVGVMFGLHLICRYGQLKRLSF